MIPIAEDSIVVHPANFISRPALDLRQRFRKCARTDPITGRWCLQTDRFVWADVVVGTAPIIELFLAVADVAKARALDQFVIERAVEPLIFALCLRMVWPAMGGPYLAAYADEMAWREDHRREPNGQRFSRVASAAAKHPVSRQWKGYWPREATRASSSGL